MVLSIMVYCCNGIFFQRVFKGSVTKVTLTPEGGEGQRKNCNL